MEKSHHLFFENLAGFATVGGTDDAVFFHHVDDPGRTSVAEAHLALEVFDTHETVEDAIADFE